MKLVGLAGRLRVNQRVNIVVERPHSMFVTVLQDNFLPTAVHVASDPVAR